MGVLEFVDYGLQNSIGHTHTHQTSWGFYLEMKVLTGPPYPDEFFVFKKMH